MVITGIVMECNPFHYGHQYILDEARRRTRADYIVVVLSGDYVQRGIPAIFSKELRTRKVLQAGADLVLELPIPYATGAANHFATGAMSILASLGIVTDLAFGSLMADKDAIIHAAGLLDEEPPEFKRSLQDALSAGLSYPAARASAAANALGISLPTNGNDVLGIEYVRALNTICTEHHIQIHAIPRIDTDSATTWRTRLLAAQSQNQTDRSDTVIPQTSASGISSDALQTQESSSNAIYTEQDPTPYCMSADDLSSHLYYRLQSITWLSGCINTEAAAAALMTYQDVDHDLACRIVRLLPEYIGWSDYVERLKTRNITYTRVSRALLHILLNIKVDDVAALRAAGSIGYVRILGLRKSAGPLLTAVQENIAVPLITSPRAGLTNENISSLFREQLQRDLAASELYDHIARTHTTYTGSKRICEYTKQMILL